MANSKSVSAQLQREGLHVMLYRGEGYLYFIFDDGEAYESESVMVPRFSDLAPERWLEMGREFAGRMAALAVERKESLAENKIWRRMAAKAEK